eukprot:RCo006955
MADLAAEPGPHLPNSARGGQHVILGLGHHVDLRGDGLEGLPQHATVARAGVVCRAFGVHGWGVGVRDQLTAIELLCFSAEGKRVGGEVPHHSSVPGLPAVLLNLSSAVKEVRVILHMEVIPGGEDDIADSNLNPNPKRSGVAHRGQEPLRFSSGPGVRGEQKQKGTARQRFCTQAKSFQRWPVHRIVEQQEGSTPVGRHKCIWSGVVQRINFAEVTSGKAVRSTFVDNVPVGEGIGGVLEDGSALTSELPDTVEADLNVLKQDVGVSGAPLDVRGVEAHSEVGQLGVGSDLECPVREQGVVKKRQDACQNINSAPVGNQCNSKTLRTDSFQNLRVHHRIGLSPGLNRAGARFIRGKPALLRQGIAFSRDGARAEVDRPQLLLILYLDMCQKKKCGQHHNCHLDGVD